MTTFAYRAATPQGAITRGVEDATSAELLAGALTARGLLPLEVAPAASPAAPRRREWRGRQADAIDALRYLATLVAAGFPLDRALATTARVAARADVAAAVAAVRGRVRAGTALATALAEHPRIFPALAVGMTRAGERGGDLAGALARLAEQLEHDQAVRARVQAALLYPCVMLVAGSVAVVVLLGFVLPRLVEMLAETGTAPPRSTALLLAAGAAVQAWWPVLLPALVVAVALAAAYARSADGRCVVHRALLRVPVVGTLRRQRAAAHFGRALSALLGSGHPALPALDIAADTLADRAASAAVHAAREQVRAGARLSQALAAGGVFPFLFLQMVEVGEDGGRLPEMLARAAGAMEQAMERRLDALVRLIEPAMVLLFGGLVGSVALAMLQAVYSVRAEGL